INPFYFCGPDGKEPHVGDRAARPVDDGTPRIRGVHLAHVTATGVRASAGHVFGLPEAPLSDLSIDDFSAIFADDPEPAAPEMASGLEPVTHRGLELGAVHGAHLSRIRVRGARGAALTLSGCEDVTTEVREG